MSTSPKNAVCGTCTLKLAAIAYRRAPWFRLLREPLKLGMRILVRFHRVNADEYAVRTPACYHCIRFYKTALKEKSATFRRIHRWVNPAFDFCLEKIVTAEELEQAQRYAKGATEGTLSPDEADDWMSHLKTGL